MKWIGQHIWDFISRFRNDVYIESLDIVEQEYTVQISDDGKLTKSTAPSERSRIQVRNDEGATIPAGAPIYSKGEIGGSNRIKVGICVSSDPTKMPCIGVAEFEMNTSDTKDSFAVTQGVYNTNIHGFTGLSEGDLLYVNGGVAPHLTPTKPTNGDLIQNVGIVLKTNGTICQGLLVSAIGRTNDVPWPLYVDHTTQRVGIGTSSPLTKLHVSDESTPEVRIQDTTNDRYLSLYQNNSNSYIQTSLNSPLVFSTHGSNERMRITTAGNVGIGTTSPGYKLEVNGTGSFFGNIRSGGGTLWSDSNGGVQLGYNSSDATGYLTTYYDSTSVVIGAGISQKTGITINGQSASAGNQITFRVGNAERMRLTSTGNVGIGTTSPSQKLHVIGDARIQGNLTVNGTYTQIDTDVTTTEQWLVTNDGTGPAAVINQLGTEDIFDVQDDGTSVLYVKDGGNIGVGTTSPDSKLHVYGTSNPVFKVEDDGGAWGFMQAAGSNQVYVGSGPSANLSIYAGLSSAITILASNRNVGIGNTNPGYKLDVSSGSAVGARISTSGFSNLDLVSSRTSGNLGGIRFKQDVDTYQTGEFLGLHGGGFEWKTGNGTALPSTRMILNTSGNVGIGTTSPARKLSIQGDGNTALSITSPNTNYVQLALGDTDDDNYGQIILDNSTNKLQIQNGGGSIVSDRGITLDSSENVGIGTSSPSKELHIKSYAPRLLIEGTGASAENEEISRVSGLWDGTYVADIQFLAGDDTSNKDNGKIAFRTYTSDGSVGTRMLIDEAGNVGIGTTSPHNKAHITSSGNQDGLLLDLNTGSSGDYTGVYFKVDNNTTNAYKKGGLVWERTGSYNEGRFHFLLNNEDNTNNVGLTDSKFTILSTGNVGIGTTSPGNKLEVNSGTTNVAGVFKSSDNQAWISVQDDDSGTYGALFGTDSDAGHDIILADSSANKRLVIDGSGNVGIGTTSPGQKLEVAGNVKLVGDNRHIFFGGNNTFIGERSNSTELELRGGGSNTAATAYIDNSGNLGLGVSNPSEKLEVSGKAIIRKSGSATAHADTDLLVTDATATSSTAAIEILGGNAGHSNIKFADTDSYTSGSIDYSHSSNSMTFRTNNSQNVTINSSGEVGIGTTSPQKKLDVSGGDIRLDNSRGIFFASTDANIGRVSITGDEGSDFIMLKVDNNNNHVLNLNTTGVGIGTTSPSEKLEVAGNIKIGDNDVIKIGDGDDLRIQHSSGDSSAYIQNYTGNLNIQNLADDKDIIFQCDDGSGGVQTYLTIDGSLEAVTVPDTIYLAAGSGLDLSLRHDGTNSHIQNNTGDLTIKNTANDKDIIFQSDDGSGGVETYFFLDGSNGWTTFPDNKKTAFGTGNDLQIYHDGSNSYLRNTNGNLYIKNELDDGDIIFQSDDGSGGLAEYLRIDGGEGRLVHSANSRYLDNVVAMFGTGADLQIYHDGSNSYIKDGGTGSLYTLTNAYRLTNAAGNENMIWAEENSFVKLYHNNSAKLETTSTGVEVAGNISLTGSVQRQISTTHHTFTTVNGGSAAQDYWVPFIGTNELAAPNVTHRTIAPYGGILKKAIVHSTAAFGSSAQVRFHRIDNGTASVFTNLNDTDDVTTNVTADMSTAYSSVAFDFTTGNTFSAGDQIGVSFVRDNTTQGDVAMTLVWEYELF